MEPNDDPQQKTKTKNSLTNNSLTHSLIIAQLASQKAGLVQQPNESMVKVSELEDGILKGLAASEGDITEDVALIESLEESKRVANDISIKLEQGKKTTALINKTSEKYRPVARRGAQLFFIMSELVKIHTYYIYR